MSLRRADDDEVSPDLVLPGARLVAAAGGVDRPAAQALRPGKIRDLRHRGASPQRLDHGSRRSGLGRGASALPGSELLGGREPTVAYFDTGNSCFDLTIFEARALAAAFIEAFPDFDTDALAGSSYVLAADTRVDLGSGTVGAKIELWPLLPAGASAAWGG